MNRMLSLKEQEGALYGMRINKGKCEYLCFGPKAVVHFHDGRCILPSKEVKYLGCALNNRADGNKEVVKRISDCFVVLKKLELFWRHGGCSVRQKLLVYDVVIRAN